MVFAIFSKLGSAVELGDIAPVFFVLAARCRQAMPTLHQATWTPIP
jgi:hypothetical protein